jgi:phenol/toluene 2-monooxygenase (NADH) P5/A5
LEFERNEGKALVCVATRSSDVTIEADVEVEEGVTHPPVRDFTDTVAAIEDIARATRRV